MADGMDRLLNSYRETRLRLLRHTQQRLSRPGSKCPAEESTVTLPSRKVPMDELAKEWLQGSSTELDVLEMEKRVYLIQRLLPALIQSLEKLLMEVESRGIEGDEKTNPMFNPLNYLAEQLMRTNPGASSNSAHSNLSSYSESLREVLSQLQQMVCQISAKEEDKGTQIREELRKRKDERMREQAIRLAEREKRKDVVSNLVEQWCEQTVKEGIPASEVLQTVRSCLENLAKHPQADILTECMTPLLSQAVDGDMIWNKEVTCMELLQYCYNLPAECFTLFTEQLCAYIVEKKQARIKCNRRAMLREVFYLWDRDDLNMVARQELLDLLVTYYNTAPAHVRDNLSNPENWPLMDDTDKMSWLDDEEIEEEEEDGSHRWSSDVSEDDLQQFLTSTPHTSATSKPGAEEGKGEQENSKPVKKTKEENGVAVDSTGMTRSGDTGSSALPPLPSGPGAQWSPTHLSLDQFIHICEMFIGDQQESSVKDLSTFLTANITNTEHKATPLSNEMKLQALLQLKAQKISSLFVLWDSDCAGSLNVTELELVLSKWTGRTQSQVNAAMSALRAGQQLTRLQFTNLIEELSSGMEAAEFREFADYLYSSFKSTHEEKQRTQYRQQWLSSVRSCGQTIGLQVAPALQEAVLVIEKDAKQFGGGKSVCVCVSVLEQSSSQQTQQQQQQQCSLAFKAASEDAQSYVLGKKLHKNSAPVSFSVVETGTTVHIPNTRQHGKVFYFNSKLRNSRDYRGSLVVAPIITAGGRVLGTISVDSVTRNERANTSFAPHELCFIQGVGLCLGEVFCYTAARRKLISVAETAMLFLQQRCPSVLACDFYLVKPQADEAVYQLVLAKSLSSGQPVTSNEEEEEEEGKGGGGEGGGEGEGGGGGEGQSAGRRTTTRIVNNHDSFREYLFQCVDSSELMVASVHCQPHVATPLRDTSGCAIAVLDITLTQSHEKLSRQHRRDIAKTVKLLSVAFQQLSRQEQDGVQETQSAVALFHSLLLADLNNSLSKVDSSMFAELRSYVDPPSVIMKIVQALLMILMPHHTWTSWTDCKQSVTLDLLRLMQQFDPTRIHEHTMLDRISKTLREISPAEVFKHGSLPTKYVYTWVSSCATVLEHCSNKLH